MTTDDQFGSGADRICGPHRVPRIECGGCGHEHHIDSATGEYQGRCSECYGFLRRPTDSEKRRFYDFMEWKARHMNRSGDVRTDGGTARRTGGDDHTHNGVLTLTDDGLELPERYRDVREAGTIVLRTPRSTIQHRSAAQFGERYPLIDASHFGRAARFENPANPSLAPSSVSLKREGEPERIFEVVETDGENDSESESDGDGDGHRASDTDSA